MLKSLSGALAVGGFELEGTEEADDPFVHAERFAADTNAPEKWPTLQCSTGPSVAASNVSLPMAMSTRAMASLLWKRPPACSTCKRSPRVEDNSDDSAFKRMCTSALFERSVAAARFKSNESSASPIVRHLTRSFFEESRGS